MSRSSKLHRGARTAIVAGALSAPSIVACGTDDSATQPSGTASSTTGATSTTTGAGGEGGTTSASVTTSATTTSVATGAGGAGGSIPWPTCDAQPEGVPSKTIHEVWQDDPAQPTAMWVPGVYVTAVSKSACEPGVACQFFVQQDETYGDLAAGAQQAIKVFASAATAEHFTSVKVGDKVDVYAWGFRYDVNGEHELLLEVNLLLPGCVKKVGVGVPKPVKATLPDLTLSAYEDTLGPLLVTVDAVVGTPHLPDETFAIYESGVFSEAGPDEIISLSPYFLANAQFTGFAAETKLDFASVTGVFGLFQPMASPLVKYKEIYPRTMADVVVDP